MLHEINKTMKTNDVVSLKLTSGEELIAKVVDVNEKGVTISKPLTLGATQQGVGLVPFMMTINEDAKLTINFSNVTAWSHTRQELKSAYLQATTGLVTPTVDTKTLNLGN